MITLLLAAQAAQLAACPATPALPRELAGWRSTAGELASFRAVNAPTMDPRTVRLADVPPPARPGRMALQTVRITRAGTYGIALASRGWVDLYRAGDRTPLVSTQHGHGPDCSGIRKIVRYALQPGTYRVMVSELTAPSIRMMLVKG